ncbi:LuxR C-terminal-related transcriptional regulator [soil metagenome]
MQSVSTDHILSTKLVIPASPSCAVLRSRLFLPDESPRIILVCAPAGYGKTTLIASWAAVARTPFAWLSLDAGDNDPVRFLMHFITAIQTRFPEFGQVVVEMMQSSPPPPIAGLMRTLINQLCDLPERICMVLDDLHLVGEATVHGAIGFLVDHQPSQLQLIFASRSDPPFSLARIRGQRQLLEYRAADLRFTLEEAGAFCNDVMKFKLPPAQVETLATRTEGWIVGLQLAAVSLHNNPDKDSFINSFAGDDRHITDFLLDEVLRSRSEEVQNFLLQTSLLERFNARLCDAVTGRTDSRAMIDELERNNLFILGLDTQRNWYRYHHLFTSLLKGRLRSTQPELTRELNRRASLWFQLNDLIPEAINHAIASADHEFAADLLEQYGRTLFSHGRINTALAWARQLPAPLVAQRPVLSMSCAWSCFYMDDLPGLERHIDSVAASLADFHDAPFGSKEHSLLGQVSLLRGCHYAYNGNIDRAIAHLKEALASFPIGRTLNQVASVCLGVCYFVAGRLEDAEQLLADIAVIAEAKQNIMVPITASLGVARICVMRGRLHAARQVYEKTLRICMDAGWQDFPACGMLHIGLGELAYEMNDLTGAEEHLTRGVEMTSVGMQYVNAWGRVLLAQTKLALGVTVDIFDIQREASALKYSGRFVVDLPPVSASIARFLLSQGRLDLAGQWVESARLPLDGPLSVGREAEYLALARILIATQKQVTAIALLEKLWSNAKHGNRVSVMIEILILEALALHAEAQAEDALAALKKSLELAENTGFLRIFINEGATLAAMLKKLARGADYTSYAHTLLGYFVADPAAASVPLSAPLPLLFSKKERQVVSFISKGTSTNEIAEALFISPNTLNSHMKSIYAKLGVNSRQQAVVRLQKLGLTS